MSEHSPIRRRKDEHLDICLSRDVEPVLNNGFERWRLEYDAMPELDLQDVELGCTVLGRPLSAPVLIGAMTGGSPRAAELNARLAHAAASLGLGMQLGSQRAMLLHPELSPSYAVRELAPALPLLIGNLGAVQLAIGLDQHCRDSKQVSERLAEALHRVRADAVSFHLNPLHEASQVSGDTRFSGVAQALAEAVRTLHPIPCMVKEVGNGLSARTAAKLAALPLAGVEASGLGGTSWPLVESFRSDPLRARLGRTLSRMGVSTAESLQNCRAAFGERCVIASGGIRNGYDAAIALALGADAVAVARPLLQAAAQDSAEAWLLGFVEELRAVCFACGVRRPAELHTALRQVDARAD
ncbi:MAG: type 2 isopentenyl-diphosphate Delta-isomerase [Myxococcota bacterium]|nr:type 2 isopentenyl-diphosphate Delta-isomerase [Myxococcota bacterium]